MKIILSLKLLTLYVNLKKTCRADQSNMKHFLFSCQAQLQLAIDIEIELRLALFLTNSTQPPPPTPTKKVVLYLGFYL